MADNETVQMFEHSLNQRLQYLADSLRNAADMIEGMRQKKGIISEVHPITGGYRNVAVAVQAHRVVNDLVHHADLPYLYSLAAQADMAWFPQTQEM